MPYPIAVSPVPAGSANPNPAYTGTFIPQTWEEALIRSLYDLTIARQLCIFHDASENKRVGDKITVPAVPRITVAAYSANQGLDTQRPSQAAVDLNLDAGWYFNTIVDKVYEIQAKPDLLKMFSEQGALELKTQLDTYLLNTVLPAVGAVAATNAGLTAGAITTRYNLGVAGTPLKLAAGPGGIGTTDVRAMLSRLSAVLDEAGAPTSGRWCVVPPWIAELLATADTAIGGGEATSGPEARVCRFARLDVYSTPFLTSVPTAETKIIAGHRDATLFAVQVREVEELVSKITIGRYVRGLCAAGGKSLNPKLLAQAVVTA